MAMPLSEDEQRILSQIEEQFYESDPAFANSVSQNTLYRHSFRTIKFAAVGLVAGLGFLVATLRVHFLVAFAGFVVMLVSAFVIERNARRMGRAGWEQMTRSMPGGRITSPLGGASERMRNRFRRRGDR
jgi:hypothetical protein